MIYVVVACHFKSATELCATTVARLEKVVELVTPRDRIVVTGDVPYKLSGPTLGSLMSAWLADRGIPRYLITVLKGGVGTFSEARRACTGSQVPITVVSSSWYLFQARQIWRRRAWENGREINFISVKNTGGWRTWVTYVALGLIIRTLTALGFEATLESCLTRTQESRREDFKFDGCR